MIKFLAIFFIFMIAKSAMVVGQSLTPQATSIDTILMRITHAYQMVSYSGRFLQKLQHAGKSMEFQMETEHWAPEKTILTFLSPEKLKGTTVAIAGEKIRAKGEKHIRRIFRFGGPSPWLKGRQIFREINLLKQNYEIRIKTDSRWLDRPTLLLKITPRYPGRPEIQLWVDQENYLILKMERISPLRNAPELFRFSQIRFEKPDTTLFVQTWAALDSASEMNPISSRKHKAENYADLASLFTTHDSPVLVPEKLPPGFVLRRIRRFKRHRRAFLHFLYGDGLTFISLFQRSGAKKDKSQNRDHQKGFRRHETFSVVRGRKSDISFSLVSEIPQTELKKVAQSLIPITKKSSKWSQFSYLIPILIFALVIFYFWQRREK